LTVLVLLPLLVILVSLYYKRHMLEAGVLGALTAMLIGWIALPQAANIVQKAVPGMLGALVPIMYSATAMAVGKAGGFGSLLKLVRRAIGERLALVAGAIVLIQAVATYAAGLGAGNTMVTGPLALAAVGAAPTVIAGMAIATAASFTTSPSSSESVVIAKTLGTTPVQYADTMLPFTLLFWALGIGLAVWGVARRGGILTNGADTKENETETSAQLWRTAAPTIYFVLVVVAGKYLNAAVGWPLFTPVFNVISTLGLLGALNLPRLKDLGEDLINGSSFILTKLFAIGLFLGFINILGEIGTFKYIAELTKSAPPGAVVAAAALAGFLVAIPAGAYSVGVISLILPALANIGLSAPQMGLIAMAVGMGTQVSLVQINVAALSQTFNMGIAEIVKNNMRFVPAAFLVICILAFVI
jgi:hypothetical protein